MHVLIVDAAAQTTQQKTARIPEIDGVVLHRTADYADAHRLSGDASIDLALIDLPRDDARALQLISEFRRAGHAVPVAVGTRDDVDFVRTVMRAGAYDYLNKRRMETELTRLINNLRGSDDQVSKHKGQVSEPLARMVGESEAMGHLKRMIRRVAESDRPVLVTGPTGAGKELVVESIHRLSSHSRHPLLDLNCGAIPESLMESQLFGHVRGAFTGASEASGGLLAAVGEGTLFLDEIAELPMPLQAKLLRAVETNRFRAVGSTTEQVFRGRIVAATHADLYQRYKEGRFREDLFYRLAVLMLKVPSLDERRADIPKLAEHFARMQPRPVRFSADAIAYLKGRSWPGNIRQLRNTIDRVTVLSNAVLVTRHELESTLLEPAEDPKSRLQGFVATILGMDVDDKLEAAHDAIIDEALRIHDGNKSAAARALGVHRKVIERWLTRARSPTPARS